MAEPSGRTVVERYARAVQDKDHDALAALVTDDYVDEMPQSGERVRGKANLLGYVSSYPGGVGTVDPTSARLVGAEDRWVITPMFSPLRIEGSGDVYTYVGAATYCERRDLADDPDHRTPPGQGRQDHVLVRCTIRGTGVARAVRRTLPRAGRRGLLRRR